MMKNSRYEIRTAILGAWFLLVVLLGPMGSVACAQALPAAEASPISTGFALPTAAGSLQYAVSASESIYWGYYTPNSVSSGTNLSGDLAYISNSKRAPFSAVLAGGRSWSTSNQSSYSFASLGLSQVLNAGRWMFVVSDAVSYLPGTATAGLSGVPGVGDLGVSPVQVGADTGQGVLTNFSNQVSNTVSGSAQRQLTGKTAINASGSYGILRFVSNSNAVGLDSDSVGGGGGITHQFDPRNQVGANYSYSTYRYVGGTVGLAAPDFNSQTASASFSHQFTRKLGMSVAAGPQWTTLNAATTARETSLFADVSAAYSGRFTHSSLAFVRSTNSGFGVIGGALSNSVVFGASRTFATVWNCSASAAYTRSSTLSYAGIASSSFDTAVVGGQVSRAIVRSLSGYASYTVEHQSISNPAAAVNAFNGLSQVVGFGVTYSPSALRIGRR